jgi:hypothetical protein
MRLSWRQSFGPWGRWRGLQLWTRRLIWPSTGRYYSDEIDTTYNIELQGSSLVITRHRYPATPLAQTSGSRDEFTMTKFSRPLPTGTVRFTRDVTQRVNGLLISGSHRIYDFPLTKQH